LSLRFGAELQIILDKLYPARVVAESPFDQGTCG
jgi:hypothetical protein